MITVELLEKDELMYEVSIRGGEATGNVMELRQLYRALRSENNEKGSNKLNEDQLAKEVEKCKEKMVLASQLLSTFKGRFLDAQYKKIDTKLSHILGRIHRIEVKATRMDLLMEVMSLFEELEEKAALVDDNGHVVPRSRQAEAENIPLEPICQSTATQSKSPATLAQAVPNIPANYFTPPKESTTSVNPFSMGKSVPVYKWGLKFSGLPEESVEGFIIEVEEKRRCRFLTEKELFESAYDLFHGDALAWFRAVRGNLKTWNELTTQLRESFQGPAYGRKLLEEIRNRVQGSDESVTIYFAKMKNLFLRLPNPLSESQKISIVERNLNPNFVKLLPLSFYTTIGELESICRKLEDAEIESKERTPSISRVTKLPLEPDLAYRPPRKEHRSPIVAPLATRTSVICWNCRGEGHVSRQCSKPFSCYGCGRPGVRRTNCSSCKDNKPGNSTGGRAGSSTSPTVSRKPEVENEAARRNI